MNGSVETRILQQVEKTLNQTFASLSPVRLKQQFEETETISEDHVDYKYNDILSIMKYSKVNSFSVLSKNLAQFNELFKDRVQPIYKSIDSFDSKYFTEKTEPFFSTHIYDMLERKPDEFKIASLMMLEVFRQNFYKENDLSINATERKFTNGLDYSALNMILLCNDTFCRQLIKNKTVILRS